ncbi:DNA repair photolyase [Lachnospiraceae bacterium PM6-15]|uniref:SPL family radical SAM protein n=1 Tax=Ohessyouella blattaphilus TaxID=2949333 RepID=UPI003E31DCC8
MTGNVPYLDAKTIITRAGNPGAWFGMDYNMNIYRGCSHGCIYCDSRSDCYEITNFDQVQVKRNALKIIREELKRKKKKGVVATGAMSDPYNPLEKDLELTRGALTLLSEYGFGAAIATKSGLLERDIDILKKIKEEAPVICKVTITTADDELSKQIEPGAFTSFERFDLIRALADNDIFSGILLMPVLPYLEDTPENIREVVRLGAECGAKFVYPAFGMTLRGNQREHYLHKLDTLFPERGLRAQYHAEFGTKYQCVSPRAKELWQAFKETCEEKNIVYRMNDIIDGYQKPYEIQQLSLF